MPVTAPGRGEIRVKFSAQSMSDQLITRKVVTIARDGYRAATALGDSTMSRRTTGTTATDRFGVVWRTAAVAAMASVLLMMGASPAIAAGPAVLSIEITAVDPITGAPVTTAGYGQQNNRLAYRIAYSCSEADCTNAVVTLPAVELDPTWGQFRLHAYETWTPPAGGGATITNALNSGITVQLGTLPAGTSATFQVQYQRATDTSAPNPTPTAYFPPGYQIQRSATISSPNATASVTADAAPVTWQIGIPSPSVVKNGPANVRPDTDMTYSIGMSDGCFSNVSGNRWVARGNLLCAESYTVVDQLPQQAQFVSASDGGTYDAVAHTVTWTRSAASAAGGWGVASVGGWSQGYGYNARTVTVRYPASAFPEGAGGADFIVPVTNDVDVSVTYLDDAATTKTTSTSFTHDVIRAEPFGRADQTKLSTSDQIVGGQRYVNIPPDTTGLVCPVSGRDDWNRVCTPGQPVAAFATQSAHYWIVDVANRANVPGVATIVDNNLGDSTLRVYRIDTNASATFSVTLSNGTSATATGGSYIAPAGVRILTATVVSSPIAGPNILPSGTASTTFRANFRYEVPVGAPVATWTNTATTTMAYPGYPSITPIDLQSTGTVSFRDMPKVTVPVSPPSFSAGFDGAPVVQGGGQVLPGGRVTYGVRATTANIPADRDVSPQYAFIAPAGWTVEPNSASFPAGSVPVGVTYTYKTVTVSGVARQAVIASWPSGATFGKNATWPTMSVVASPTAAVAAGTSSSASVWVGDSRNAYDPSATTWGGKVVDATDIDGDGNSTEAFSTISGAALTVGGSARLDVIKEICVETPSGCNWVSNPDIVVGVAPDADDIQYRVTVRNAGNTVLSGVIAYDVLPWIGDARGSTFGEVLNSVSNSSANLTLSYSASTNPCRAEVLPTNPTCVSGWAASATGAQAIRATVTGNLAPGASSTFVFSADVVPGAGANAVACNSVAVDSDSTLPGEPRPVCATTQEADLRITVPDRLPLQAGRPGTVPFTVTNLGGSPAAPATVAIEIPAGIRITSLTPAGWLCTAGTTAPDGSVVGPVTLSCDAVDATGVARGLAIGVPTALDLPAVIPDDILVGQTTCFPATVSGLMFDPVDANNEDEACFSVLAGDALVSLTKDDGLDDAEIGDELTYTIDVANLLVGETLSDLVITDVLPDHFVFVAASAGGTVFGQGTPDAQGDAAGGTVTWTIDELEAAGVIGDGDEGSGNTASTGSVSVTVRVLQAAEALDEITNEATLQVADPASPDTELTDSDSDTDELLRTPDIQIVKSVSPMIVTTVGSTVTYEFLVTNSGDVTLADVAVDETEFTGLGDALQIDCPTAADSLAPGASVTCTATYEVAQGDLDAGTVTNTATATGTPPTGLSSPTSQPSTAIFTAQTSAAITLVKSASPVSVSGVGEEVDYEFRVTNTGTVTVTDVTVAETAFSGDGNQLTAIQCPAGAASLAPTASVTCTATYTVTQDDVDAGSISNTATASANAPGALADPVSSPSTALVSVPAGAELTLQKSISAGVLDSAGDTVTYLFEVTNTGNVTVSSIAIDEQDFTGSGQPVVVVCPTTPLAPLASVTCVGTYDLVQADVDAGIVENSAVATGIAPNSAVVTSDESTAILEIDPEPELALVKSATPTTLVLGQTVTYSFVVTNTGNVTIDGVVIDETAFTGSGTVSAVTCTPASTTLAPDAQLICSATYTITQPDVDAATLSNTAMAIGDFGGDPVTSDPSSVQLPFTQSAGIELTKSADVTGYSAVGDTVGYTFRVANSGNVSMSAVGIIEDEFSGTGMLSAVVCPVTTLLPGQFTDCTADYSVTQADIDAGELVNAATAQANAPLAGLPTLSGRSTVVVPFVGQVGLALAKAGQGQDANGDGIISAGDRIRWSFTVTNTGVATLSSLSVADPMVGAVSCAATLVPPGATVTCTAAEMAITAAHANAGSVVNTATATARAGGGVVVESDEASATVAVAAQPLAWTGSGFLWIAGPALLALLLGLAALAFARLRRA